MANKTNKNASNNTDIKKINEKRLDHLMRAYSAAESVFPAWEGAFALIIGQLLIACLGNYDTLHNKLILIHIPLLPDKVVSLFDILALFGLVLSLFWFILVTLNLQHANILDSKIKICEKILDHAYKNESIPEKIYGVNINAEDFGSAFPEKNQKPGFCGLILGKKKDEPNLQAIKKLPISTWAYRRVLPLIPLIIWIILLIFKDP